MSPPTQLGVTWSQRDGRVSAMAGYPDRKNMASDIDQKRRPRVAMNWTLANIVRTHAQEHGDNPMMT